MDATYTPDSFTAAYAAAVRQRLPGAEVRVESPLVVDIERAGQGVQRIRLDHPWQVVASGSGEPEAVLGAFVNATTAELTVPEGPALVAALRPVIKPIDYVRAVFEQLGAGQVPVYALVGELYIMLVADTDLNMAIVSNEQLTRAGLEPQGALHLAIQNLVNALPEIGVHGEGARMVVAGGNYEASLLLVSSIWQELAAPLSGALIAVPFARDLLVYADTGDAEAMRSLREMVVRAETEQTFGYAISTTPLRWTGGGWSVHTFEDDA